MSINEHYDPRAHVASANAESLMSLLRETGISLGPNALQWRPTQRSRGNITGLFGVLEILCTDGIVAWFKDSQGVLIYGHVSHYSGKVQTLHGVPRPYHAKDETAGVKRTKARSASSPRKPCPTASDALALLASLIEQPNAAPKAP